MSIQETKFTDSYSNPYLSGFFVQTVLFVGQFIYLVWYRLQALRRPQEVEDLVYRTSGLPCSSATGGSLVIVHIPTIAVIA